MKKSKFFKFKMCYFLALSWLVAANTITAQSVTITVDATQNKRLISPYIYGKNEGFDQGVSLQLFKDAGLRFARMNRGNNASAYNWRTKLGVHPDWMNNVYDNSWDKLAQTVTDNFPYMQGMFAFQLLGRSASSDKYNFPDWEYMQAHPGWNGFGQNLAGGGTPDPNGGSKALIDGNIDLFSKPWPADSSVAILNYWFGANGKGFNKNQFVYWSMDNEVDIWSGTHDWAMPTQLSASAFMDRYIELAKKAKALYPGIKLCGPVTTSEWQWYKWSNESIYINGRYYSWIEYFIKRLGDEYKATGTKLVDVLDIHNYPWYNGDNAAALQGHRIYYDELYDYPGSNGIRTSTGGWDTSLTKQYIFKRINNWLTEHFGANHGITAGLSEWGTMTTNSNPNIESVIYASHLGTFANNDVELFSPWNWSVGMWETLHLFSKNAKKYSISSTSTLENTVSAYSSINETTDSLTVILVNRDMAASRTVTINLSNFDVANGNYKTLQLSSLPTTETFVSETQNALKTGSASVSSNSITITVPALSTTAILLAKSNSTPPPTTYSIITNRATGLLIDGMSRTNNGDNCGQWSNSGSPAQEWVVETVGSYVKVKNRQTGLYLDGMGRTANNSIVGQYSSSTNYNQQWQLVTSGSYIKIKNRATGLYIDGLGKTVNGADLGQYKRSSSNNQLWTIATVGQTKSATIMESIEEEETSVLIYPNPFASTFNLKIGNVGDITRIEILNMSGKLIESVSQSAISNNMELGAQLKPGIYLVKTYGAGNTETFKVIKK